MIQPIGAPSPAAEAARRNSEKAQIQDITERFRNYIKDVKILRDQLKQADAASSVQHLQNEIISIRNMYEQEIGNLREKLEQNYRAQDSDGFTATLASEYQNRIWEMNRDILKKDEDIRALQVLVAQKESEVQALKGAAISPSIQLEMTKQELGELQRNIVMAQEKYEEEFSQRFTLEDTIRELTQQTEQLKYNHMKESQALRAQVAQSEALVLQLEDKLRRLSHGGPALMETVQKIQEASEAEVKRLQDETESAYSQTLLELQMRLHNDQILLGQAQEDNERLLRRAEELTSQVTSLEKKLFSEESNNRTLMEKMEAEQMRGRQHIEALEARLEELQDLLLAKMKELKTFQETNVSLRNELDVLKSMLEEEEHRMTASSLHPLYRPPSSTHLLSDSFQSPIFNTLPGYTKTNDLVSELRPSDPSRTSGSATTSDGKEEKPDLQFPEEEEGQRIEEQVKRPHTAPFLSSTASDLSKRQSSFASMVENNAYPQVIKNTESLTGRGNKAAVSSALGNLEITEVHPGGDFVRIVNQALDKEEDIGGFLLQQNICGHPVSIYRFPPKSRVMASCEVTVWASAAGVPHNPPTDYLWKEQTKFVTEPKCTTILCNRNGQAMAWFTPLREKNRKSLEKYEVSKSEAKFLSSELIHEPSPTDRETPADGRSRSPKSPPVYGKPEREPRLLRREKIPPVVLPATSSPWTQSTASPTHPDYNPDHIVLLGSKENNLCRQTRSQTARTAPPSDVLSAEQRNGKDGNELQRRRNYRGPIRSAGPNSRGVLYLGYSSPAGSVLQKYFANSSYNIRLASQVSLAPTILSSV
ncbi:lamin tail domain-containing protein 1 isoform X2 [Hyla sarda]|uniref:lamin tail domain-containing protein 1 isoform X2 n=1 Tax=Hyla sarda TaxID=327740 RepID=UPI0024C29C09|nr:lamin tail domain-containing protein 1 isoform X2 [Hyla sarda]